MPSAAPRRAKTESQVGTMPAPPSGSAVLGIDREAQAVVVQTEVARAYPLEPARRAGEAAERVEVQSLDPGRGIGGAVSGEGHNQRIGVGQSGEPQQIAALAGQNAHRVADAAQ